MPYRPHVVQAVGELHKENAGVVVRRFKKFSQILRLTAFILEAQHFELRDAFHQPRRLAAEDLLYLAVARLGVLKSVMQKRRGDHDVVKLLINQIFGDRDRVAEIRLAGPSQLAAMLSLRVIVGVPNQVGIGIGIVFSYFLNKFLHSGDIVVGCRMSAVLRFNCPVVLQPHPFWIWRSSV